MRRLTLALTALAASAVASGGCSARSPVSIDAAGDYGADLAAPPDLAIPIDFGIEDIAICLQPRDCGVAGSHVSCTGGNGNYELCPSGFPYCCHTHTDSGYQDKCAADKSGCMGWRACNRSADCPAQAPFCCGDDDNSFLEHIDCRAACQRPICQAAFECPPDRPVCKYVCGECFSVCAKP